MAFGFPPRASFSFPLGDVAPHRLIALVHEVVEQTGWKLGHVNENELVAYTGFSWRSWSEEVRFTIDSERGVVNVNSFSVGVQLIDFGKNTQNIRTLMGMLQRMYLTTDEALLDKRYDALMQQARSEENDIFNRPVANIGGKMKGFLAVFVPSKGYKVTPILLYLNVLVFFGLVLTGIADNGAWTSENLMMWGSNYRSNTFGGEWWRLITCAFVHIGFMHLFFNMYALLYVGVVLEPVLGRARFIAAYFITALLASTASAATYDGIVAAGASGAIFGMYGVFIALLFTNLIERAARRSMFLSLAIFVGYALYNGLTSEGIDNAAHVGGLISGLVVGFALYRSLVEPDETEIKYGTTAWLCIGAVAIAAAANALTPVNSPKFEDDYSRYASEENYGLDESQIDTTPLHDYRSEMERFKSMEAMALETYRLSPRLSKEDKLNEIKNRGIYYWNENIVLVKRVDEMALPERLHQRNKLLLEYCEWRIKACNLMYDAVETDTNPFNNGLDSCEARIAVLLAELSDSDNAVYNGYDTFEEADDVYHEENPVAIDSID